MKQKNKEKRLLARQKAYDILIEKHSEFKSCYRRPGSMKKS